MRLVSEARNIEAAVPNKVVDFKIKASAKAFQVMTSNLYTDRPRAIVRELASNAVDAHIAAGKRDVPIQVHLPTAINSSFRVIDEGPGMSEELVENILTTVFETTKDTSDDEIGGFGLGSKSPFSYTDTFTVISRHGGREKTYTAFIQATGTPGITKVYDKPCGDETGVEVIVPVRHGDHHKFRLAAERTFQFFEVTPHCPSATIEKPKYELELSKLKIVKAADRWDREILIIMGGVAYPLDWHALPAEMRQEHRLIWDMRKVHVYLPIGTCDIAPSREALSLDERTIKNIDAVFKEAQAELGTAIEREFKDYQYGMEARIRLRELSYIFTGDHDGLLTKYPNLRWGPNRFHFNKFHIWDSRTASNITSFWLGNHKAQIFSVSNGSGFPNFPDQIPTFIWIDDPRAGRFLRAWYKQHKDSLPYPCALVVAEHEHEVRNYIEYNLLCNPNSFRRASFEWPYVHTVKEKKGYTKKKVTLQRFSLTHGIFRDAEILLDDLDANTYWVPLENKKIMRASEEVFLRYLNTHTFLQDLFPFEVIGIPRSLKHLDKRMPGPRLIDALPQIRDKIYNDRSTVVCLELANDRSNGYISKLRRLSGANKVFGKQFPHELPLLENFDAEAALSGGYHGSIVYSLFTEMNWTLPPHREGGYAKDLLEKVTKRFPLLKALIDTYSSISDDILAHYFTVMLEREKQTCSTS
jgi:hypothetical protein